jgi:predicted RNA-binding protein Jag
MNALPHENPCAQENERGPHSFDEDAAGRASDSARELMLILVIAKARAQSGHGAAADQLMASAHQYLKTIADELGFRLEWRGEPSESGRHITANEHVLLAQGQVLAAYDELTKAQVERSASRLDYARGKLAAALNTLSKIKLPQQNAFASNGFVVSEVV